VNDLGLRSVYNSDVVDIIFEGSSSCRCALITGAVPSFWSGSLITGVACMSDLDQFFQISTIDKPREKSKAVVPAAVYLHFGGDQIEY
jgi:hypothetical protein